LAVLCCLSSGLSAVNAQDAHRFEVEIPFEFVLDGRMLPAGKYVVQRFDPTKPNIVMVKNADAKIVRVMLTNRVESERPSADSTLVFIRREGKLYLSEIWTGGDKNGNRIPLFNEKEPRDPYSIVKLHGKAP
jgi:hypothetical protein